MEEKKITPLNTILRNGMLGSVLAFMVSIVGLVGAFAERSVIGNILTIGQVFFIFGSILAGYLTAKALKDKGALTSLTSSLMAGFVSSSLLILLALIIKSLVIDVNPNAVFKLRSMFVSLSPQLFEILTLGQGLLPGLLYLFLIAGLLGLFGGIVIVLPTRWSRALSTSLIWVLVFGLFSENIGQILQSFFGRGFTRFAFQNKALTPTFAVILFILVFAYSYFQVNQKGKNQWGKMSEPQQKQGRLVLMVLGGVLLLVLPWMVGTFLSQMLFMVGLYVMLGLGLNIVVGYAGLLNLGYVAFFAFGAYTMGILTSLGPLGISDFNFWMALPISVLVGVIWGVILGFPVLLMRGDYLAIATLGFGEIIRILATSDWLAPIGGGPQGILKIPNPEFFGIVFNTPQTMYYLVVLGSVLTAFLIIRLRESRLGRQWMAMREDEDVAEAMGINLVQTKLLAFAIGAGFSALAGAIFAARLGNIFPHSFNLLISLLALAVIIVGGLGSIPGVIVGAIILVGMPELLREFSEYRLLMYGILLIIMMLYKPEGFIPEAARKRELRGNQENHIPQRVEG